MLIFVNTLSIICWVNISNNSFMNLFYLVMSCHWFVCVAMMWTQRGILVILSLTLPLLKGHHPNLSPVEVGMHLWMNWLKITGTPVVLIISCMGGKNCEWRNKILIKNLIILQLMCACYYVTNFNWYTLRYSQSILHYFILARYFRVTLSILLFEWFQVFI